MTLESDIEPCRGCKSTNLNTELEIPGAVCENCGLVHDGESWAETSVSDSPIQDQDNQHESEAQSPDWRSEISVQDASDQQLVRTLTVTDDLAEELTLSEDERIAAAELVTDIWNQNLMHGRTLEIVVAGAVYLTCRESGRPRPSHAIATAVDVDETRLKQASRMIARELEVQINPPGPEAYIWYVAERLGVPEHIKESAVDLLEGTRIGGNPAGIAAAALYSAYGQDTEHPTLTQMGSVAGVTKETVWRKSQQM